MSFFQKLLQKSGPLSVRDYIVRGNGNLKEGKYDQAIRNFTEAIRLDPLHAPSYIFRAGAYEQRANSGRGHKDDLKRALADYTEVIRLQPADKWAYGFRGRLHAVNGEFAHALADLAQLIRLDPTQKSAYETRAMIHRLGGDEASALNDERMIQELTQPPLPSVDAYSARALAHAEAGRHELAALDLTSAIQLDPMNAVLYSLRCGSYVELGCWEQALSDQGEAVRLEPENVLFRGKLEALLRMGDPRNKA